MDLPLHHLVYQSFATVPMGEPELEAILTESRIWNTTHGLTGVLLFSNGHIMQVLEGAEAEVRHIFARIARDLRHTHVTKLSDGPIKRRGFSQWSMGFKSVNSDVFAHVKGYVNPNKSNYLSISIADPDARLHSVLANFVTDDVIQL